MLFLRWPAYAGVPCPSHACVVCPELIDDWGDMLHQVAASHAIVLVITPIANGNAMISIKNVTDSSSIITL